MPADLARAGRVAGSLESRGAKTWPGSRGAKTALFGPHSHFGAVHVGFAAVRSTSLAPSLTPLNGNVVETRRLEPGQLTRTGALEERLSLATRISDSDKRLG